MLDTALSLVQTRLRIKTKWLFLLVHLAMVLVVPTIIHNQLITGTIVNGLLLTTSVVAGPLEAVMLGLVPSVVAMSGGLLPLALAPVVPYIMVSNAIYIYTFAKLGKVNAWLAVAVGALLKFGFLTLASRVILAGVLEPKVSAQVLVMMSYPQLITAGAGGMAAVVVSRWWGKKHE